MTADKDWYIVHIKNYLPKFILNEPIILWFYIRAHDTLYAFILI